MVIYISRHVQWKADDCQEAWRHEVLILLQHFLHNATVLYMQQISVFRLCLVQYNLRLNMYYIDWRPTAGVIETWFSFLLLIDNCIQ